LPFVPNPNPNPNLDLDLDLDPDLDPDLDLSHSKSDSSPALPNHIPQPRMAYHITGILSALIFLPGDVVM
jgi:hypothetical protein